MRRALSIVLIAAVALGLLWAGAWLYGRGVVADRLSERAQALRARGHALDIGAREIGGFPLSYVVRLSDVRLDPPGPGPVVDLAALTGRVDLSARDRLVLTAAGPVRLAPLEDGGGALDLEPEGLEIAVEGLPGEAESVSLSADALLAVLSASDEGPRLALDLLGLTAEMDRPVPGERGTPRLEIRAERIDYAAATSAGASMPEAEAAEGAPTPAAASAQGSLGPVLATASASASDLEALGAVLGGAPGRVRVAVTAGRASGRLAETGPEGAGRAADVSLGSLALGLTVEDGAMEARASAMSGAVDLFRGAGGEETHRIGTLKAGSFEGIYRMPLVPTDAPAPMGLELRLAGARPDDALWDAIDEVGALEREDLGFEVAIDASGRLTKPLAARAPGEPPPVALARVAIDRAEVSGLGARATADGAVDFNPPGENPTGRITLVFDGALALIRALNAAEILPQPQVQTLATLLAIYTVPGGDGEPDRLRTEIAFDEGEVTVNGSAAR